MQIVVERYEIKTSCFWVVSVHEMWTSHFLFPLLSLERGFIASLASKSSEEDVVPGIESIDKAASKREKVSRIQAKTCQ